METQHEDTFPSLSLLPPSSVLRALTGSQRAKEPVDILCMGLPPRTWSGVGRSRGAMGGVQLRGSLMKGLRHSKEPGSTRGEPLLSYPKAPLNLRGLFDLCLLSKKKRSPGFWAVAHS